VIALLKRDVFQLISKLVDLALLLVDSGRQVANQLVKFGKGLLNLALLVRVHLSFLLCRA
jgi:hypothetical protein